MILAALNLLGELLDASEIDAAPPIDSGVIDRSPARGTGPRLRHPAPRVEVVSRPV